ncbi:esterase-like activity of phytase family protein [Novosphingobium sp.]|uniref:esterase-like activity of phytase family protein n=1 Tax=Novosphingobium sp. TaxID=1874826 RepID=UPI0027353D05|nr:esterase-like activity of phytase family protein [Novosphingobium sp.]MDP3906327.1 esterase-like activity of phytase family protein [Novosphingobium sp.]
MLRRVMIALLIVGLTPGLWWQMPRPTPIYEQRIAVRAVAFDPAAAQLGPLRLTGVWQVTSAHEWFGGYSALLSVRPGRLLAFSDRGHTLELAIPGVDGGPPPRIGSAVGDPAALKASRDIEAATYDPQADEIFLAMEFRNAITRMTPDMQDWHMAFPRLMQGWSGNQGPEAMVRLTDGRFIVLGELSEGWRKPDSHPSVLLAGDPTRGAPVAEQAFTFTGDSGYRPTEMAQLPDGRVLVLQRRLLWPFPPRFAGSIVLADPADLRPGQVWRGTVLTQLKRPLPVDNFEGLTIIPAADGKVQVWLITDDNMAVTQRTLLWRLELDPADLPARR